MIVRAVNLIGIYDYLVSELLSILVDDCYYYGVGQPRLIVGGTGFWESLKRNERGKMNCRIPLDRV